MDVQSITAWPSNAELIADCAKLGYLHEDWYTLDPTWGRGTWWNVFEPKNLVRHDLYHLDEVDFRKLPWDDEIFDAVAFDPPYKLNGTPSGEMDERYGVDVVATINERHQLIKDGIDECYRVLKPKGYLLLKCQDQVSSGKVQWQTRIFADHAERGFPPLGNSKPNRMNLVDALLILGGRKQPKDRRQVHARRNYSTMLVFQKAKS